MDRHLSLRARSALSALFTTVILASPNLAPRTARANVGDAFGFGARSAALSGAGAAAWGFDAFAAYTNPAGLPLAAPEGKRMSLNIGIVLMEPSFIDISNVVVENKYISDNTRSDSVDTDYKSTFGQELGLTYKVMESGTLGVAVFLPINQLAYMDTGEAFRPEYVLYRARTLRPQVELAYGHELSRTLRVGAGLHIAYSLTSNATAFLNSDPTKPSTLRFSGSLKPKAAPYLGVLLSPGGKTETFTLGAVIRSQATSDNEIVLNSAARLFGSLAALDFNFTAVSALYYDPWTVELGTSWAHAKNLRFSAQLDYQFWHLFKAPALQIETPDITNCNGSCGFSISPGNNPGFPYRNILIPRIGEELTVGNVTYRVGYAYRPSFLDSVSDGAGNYLDPPKHLIGAGVGFKIRKFLGYDNEAQLDINASYQALVTEHIVKTPGNEGGDPTDQKIGAPGYDAGGKILGGGVSLTLAL